MRMIMAATAATPTIFINANHVHHRHHCHFQPLQFQTVEYASASLKKHWKVNVLWWWGQGIWSGPNLKKLRISFPSQNW